jgi:hypothetical protein
MYLALHRIKFSIKKVEASMNSKLKNLLFKLVSDAAPELLGQIMAEMAKGNASPKGEKPKSSSKKPTK